MSVVVQAHRRSAQFRQVPLTVGAQELLRGYLAGFWAPSGHEPSDPLEVVERARTVLVINGELLHQRILPYAVYPRDIVHVAPFEYSFDDRLDDPDCRSLHVRLHCLAMLRLSMADEFYGDVIVTRAELEAARTSTLPIAVAEDRCTPDGYCSARLLRHGVSFSRLILIVELDKKYELTSADLTAPLLAALAPSAQEAYASTRRIRKTRFAFDIILPAPAT